MQPVYSPLEPSQSVTPQKRPNQQNDINVKAIPNHKSTNRNEQGRRLKLKQEQKKPEIRKQRSETSKFPLLRKHF